MLRPMLRAVDAAVIYLPLVLMGVLAAASVWLLRVTPAPAEAPTATAARLTPDDYLLNFVSRQFDATGRLTAEVFGAEGKHIPATGHMDLKAVKIRHWGSEGATTDSVAERAKVNDAQTVYELMGQAEVVHRLGTGETTVITSEHLQFDTRVDVLKALQPAVVRRGKDVISGDRLVYDQRAGRTQWSGQVRATLQP
ncbi:MAG: LPS export ABC transporter periplasmic protein LptC [Burkholderiaceae bacterium]